MKRKVGEHGLIVWCGGTAGHNQIEDLYGDTTAAPSCRGCPSISTAGFRLKGEITCSHFVRAFSLIEVVISIGIIAVAIIPIMGLIPIGLKYSNNFTQEIDAMSLMTAAKQDLKYSPREKAFSQILKLPLKGLASEQVEQVWVDRCWRTYPYSEMPLEKVYALEWHTIKVANLSKREASSLYQVEITVRWPPRIEKDPDGKERTIKGGQLTSLFPLNF